MDRAVDSWFGTYRRTGDPEALGRVFDALAPRLAGRALLVLGDPTAAEDVLQSTFLAAMEHAERWDHTRPLEPWLVGILQHEIHRLRARRRHDPLDQSLDALIECDADPAERAQRDDLIVQVRQGVEGLPDGERQVLLLRLEHGLSALEIGEVLGLAPGAVRMRVHRGLERLRRRLPASLALLAAPGVRFALVRDAVLGAVPATAVASASAAAVGEFGVLGLGVLGMKKIVIALLVLGGLSVVAALGWQQFGVRSAPPARGPGSPQARDGALPSEADVVARGGDAESGLRQSLLLDPDAADPPRPASLLFRLTHSDGSPASGVTVKLAVADGSTLLESGWARAADERGEVRFTELVPGEVEFAVPGNEARGVVRLEAGREHRQDLRLGGVAEVTGRVVDGAGHPVAGAEILAADGYPRIGYVRTRSDGSGRFVVRDLCERARLSARAAGHAPSGSVEVYTGIGELRLVLPSAGAMVRGVVVDAVSGAVGGAGVPFARVLVGGRSGGPDQRVGRYESQEGYPSREVIADHAGHFEVVGAPVGGVEFLVDAPGFVTTSHHVVLDPGAHRDLELRLAPALVVSGVVVDAATGEPIAGASVWSEAFTTRQTASVRTGPDGRFALERLDPRRPLLCVVAEGYTPHRELCDATVTARQQPTRIGLQPAAALRVRFVGPDGAPFGAGGTVRVGAAEGVFRPVDQAGVALLPVAAEHVSALWVTAAEGRQWILCDWLELPLASGLRELVVTVPERALPSAWLVGVLLDAEGRPRTEAGLDLERDGLSIGASGAPDPATGAFRVGPLPPGRYLARVPAADRSSVYLGLGELTLHAGETLDLGVLGPGQAGAPRAGRLVVDLMTTASRGFGDLNAWIYAAAAARAEDCVAFLAPGSPEDRTQALMPGRYRLVVYGEDTAWRSIDFEIEAGEDTHVALDLQPATRRYLSFPWPVPAAIREAREVHFELRDAQGDCVLRDTLGDERPMTLMPALTLGRNVVELWTDQGDRFVGEVRIESLAPDYEPIPVAVERVR